jgi:hypothetical protein
MAKRKDGYEGENGGKFYSFAEKLGDIHITHSTYDSRLLPHNHDFIEILCIRILCTSFCNCNRYRIRNAKYSD